MLYLILFDGDCGNKQEEKRGAYNPAYAVKKMGEKNS
jgi:hypothetical protein